ncbi:Zinc finger and BTB domain-containing protein 16-A [Liparis tanakae]|uniref:Zinc finger and BTB domain-containing protein 16-A n=1 Tax=Liparis tanakae TaxID=230148 RepID=A0A4Z2IMV0_9TELE|nr:Zinc finger and BTB domain-containing protein 16-A [Liparis tanakae]
MEGMEERDEVSCVGLRYTEEVITELNKHLTASMAEFYYPAGDKAIVCDQCGAQFQTEESLESHRKIHTGCSTM